MKPLLITLLLMVHAAFAQAGEKLLDRIVVVVNDDVITQTMLDNRVEDFRRQLKADFLSAADARALRKQVAERMIRDRIQLQKAALLGIQVDDLMLNRVLEQLAQRNHMTLEGFRQTLESDGIPYHRFRQQTREELVIQRLQQRMVASKISVSDQEIKLYLAQNAGENAAETRYHLRHILISTPEDASPESLRQAEEKSRAVYQRLLDGADFEKLAIEYSGGRNALRGGDLGERKASELPDLFIDAVRRLAPGDVAAPVRSASGFHLLQLVSRSDHAVMVRQTHARHILIRTGEKMDDEHARARLQEIRRKLLDGADFAELASQYSDDPGSKTRGGDLGWAGPGDYVPAFERVMDSLPDQGLSEPFKSRFGWHLLQVLERREHNQTQANRENTARQAIQNRKLDEELRLWLRRIRDEAYVEYLDEALAAGRSGS